MSFSLISQMRKRRPTRGPRDHSESHHSLKIWDSNWPPDAQDKVLLPNPGYLVQTWNLEADCRPAVQSERRSSGSSPPGLPPAFTTGLTAANL